MALSSASRLTVALCALAAALSPLPCVAQAQYAVLIGGLGGSPEYTSAIRQHLFDAHAAFVGPLGLEDGDVTVLAEPATAAESIVDGVANAENIRTAFTALANRVTLQDQVYVLLFGHGSFDGTHAMLNISRRDLSSADYAQMINSLRAGRIVFINTASASGPFVAALSAPERIVITATRSGTQRNQTIFPRFLVEALANPSADLDRDGSLSVLEVYNYAALQTAGHYEENGHLATEHALIDDTGDGEGSRLEELRDSPDGHLAAVTFLRRPSLEGATEMLTAMQQNKEAIEREIAALKSRKATMNADAYFDELEVLLLRLARLNNSMDQERGSR